MEPNIHPQAQTALNQYRLGLEARLRRLNAVTQQAAKIAGKQQQKPRGLGAFAAWLRQHM